MLKKILVSVFIVFLSMMTVSPLLSENTFAEETKSDKTTSSANYGIDSTCRDFMGLTSWNCGVEISDKESIKSGVWTIASNILVDLTVIAAYLVVGYVIYGGYMYITSSGEAGKVATAKKTLAQAFIGLAIVMLTSVILNSIRIALLNGGSFVDCATPVAEGGESCVKGTGNIATNAIQWVIGVAGFVAAVYVVYGGIAYMTSSGDPGKVQRAKNMIIYALIGIAVCALAEVITSFVSSTLRKASTAAESSYIISKKEVNES